MKTEGSTYECSSITHSTISVWLIVKTLVTSAFPRGGVIWANGRNNKGSSVDAPDTAEPFLRVHIDVASSRIDFVSVGIVEFVKV